MKKIVLTLILFTATSLGLINAQTYQEMTGLPFTPGFNPSIQFFDMDNDNDQDVIISANSAVGSFDCFTELYENDGNGNYTLVTGNSFEGVGLGDITIGDVDGDGDPEILIIGKNAAQQTSTKLYENNGNGSFSLLTGTGLPDISHGNVVLADLDNDGDNDVVLSGSTTPAYPFLGLAQIYLNNGNGYFTLDANSNLPQIIAQELLVFDANNDGDKDIIISGYGSNNYFTEIYDNNGSGIFTTSTSTFTVGGDMVLIDANNDNFEDLIITGYSTTNSSTQHSALFLNNGAGVFSEVTGNNFPTTDNNASMAVADFNGDNNLDMFILSAGSGSANVGSMFINDGNGIFTENTNAGLVGLKNPAVATADINNNQENEIFVMGLFSFSIGPTVKLYEKNAPCTVNIPNANFKSCLVNNMLINTNGDNEIQCDEAAAFTGEMDCSWVGANGLTFSDMTGVEAFTAMTGLQLNSQNMTTLDLTANVALEKIDVHQNFDLTSINITGLTNLIELRCFSTALPTLDLSTNSALEAILCDRMELTSLDVSGLTNLSFLDCYNNDITSIDVTGCTALETLRMQDNQLTNVDFLTASNPIQFLSVGRNPLTTFNVSMHDSLKIVWLEDNDLLTEIDFSQNTALVSLRCYRNDLLESVNLANTNNENFSFIGLTENPNLTCLQVDDVAWSNDPANWDETATNMYGHFYYSFDPQTNFSADCGITSSIDALENPNIPFSIFPNPTNQYLNIEIENVEISQIDIIDLSGKSVQIISQHTSTVDVSNLNHGIYFIKIKTDKGILNNRFVKI